MYVIGEETAFADADTTNVPEGFTNLDFLVVQDLFFSRTAQFADVVLPACPSVEGHLRCTSAAYSASYEALKPLGDSGRTAFSPNLPPAWDTTGAIRTRRRL